MALHHLLPYTHTRSHTHWVNAPDSEGLQRCELLEGSSEKRAAFGAKSVPTAVSELEQYLYLSPFLALSSSLSSFLPHSLCSHGLLWVKWDFTTLYFIGSLLIFSFVACCSPPNWTLLPLFTWRRGTSAPKASQGNQREPSRLLDQAGLSCRGRTRQNQTGTGRRMLAPLGIRN